MTWKGMKEKVVNEERTEADSSMGFRRLLLCGTRLLCHRRAAGVVNDGEENAMEKVLLRYTDRQY